MTTLVRMLVLLSIAVCAAACLLLATRTRSTRAAAHPLLPRDGAARRPLPRDSAAARPLPREGAPVTDAPVIGRVSGRHPIPAVPAELGAPVAAAAPAAVGEPDPGPLTAAPNPRPPRRRPLNTGASHFTATPRVTNPVRTTRARGLTR